MKFYRTLGAAQSGVFWLNVLMFYACSLPTQVTELENLPQDASRSAYTQRILEIVSNIKKQKEEITKVHLKANDAHNSYMKKARKYRARRMS